MKFYFYNFWFLIFKLNKNNFKINKLNPIKSLKYKLIFLNFNLNKLIYY